MDAKTDMGEIKYDLALSSNIAAIKNGYGASYKGTVGGEAEKTIMLSSRCGNITRK